MPVETPLEALATPELDGKRLDPFCKAMELTTLTRRVAEICGVDMGSIEPDPHFVGPAAWPGGKGVALLERRASAGGWRFPAGAARSRVARPKADPQGTAPADLAAARAKEARAPIDRTAYKIVRTAAELSHGSRRGRRGRRRDQRRDLRRSAAGRTHRRLAGGRAGRGLLHPLGHRTAPTLFDGAGLAPDQIAEAEAIALLKPLLEAAGVLKIGHDVKFDMHVLAMRGVRVAPIGDAMLLSYTLDAGATGDDHSLDTLAQRFLGHKPTPISEVAGSGRNLVGIARATIERACEYGAEKADLALRRGACCSRASWLSG